MRDKRKYIWILCAVLAVFVIFFLLTAAGGRKSKTITLRFAMFGGSDWNVQIKNSYRTIDDAIIRFENSHPGATVEYASGISKDDYSEWLSEKIVKDEIPDVMMIDSGDFFHLAYLGVLEDLDPWIDGEDGFDRSIFYGSALEAGQYEGSQYALPYQTVPTMMFVNKTLLTENNINVPEDDFTLTDMYRICRLLTKDTDGDGKTDQFGIYKYTWQDAALANGAEYIDADGNCDFTSDEFRWAMKYMVQLNSLNQGANVTQEDFDAGKVAFMPLSLAEYRTYKSYPYKVNNFSNFQWDCIKMPLGPSGTSSSGTDTRIIGMSRRSHYKKLAWEFLNSLTTSERLQKEMLRYSPTASVLPAVMKSEEAQSIISGSENQIRADLIDEVLAESTSSSGVEAYGDVISLVDSEIQLMYSNSQVDLDEELRTLQRNARAYLSGQG